jgi:uncharacterized protein
VTEPIFVGRKAELDLLEKLWQSNKAALLILYGRRRVGKTRLLTYWLPNHSSSDVLYWMAEPTSALDQLRSFSQALVNFADPETPASGDFTYDSWEHALRQVSLLAKERRIAVLIDEVTYIMDVNPNIVGTLQKAWDHWLSKSNLMLALCGSQMGLMQRHLLDYEAPLYGRATAQLRLPPLPFGVTERYFPDYKAEERVQVYSMWGGIPAYWERLDPNIPVFENLRQQLLPSNTWMLDEPRLLLQDFINDPYNYVGIMRAIADGRQSLSDISARTGLSGGPTSKYLSTLRETGFVVRNVPVTETGADSRQGRYFVTDPYLRFYYRFLAAYQSQLALGKHQQTLRNIEAEFPKFIEENTWQELCREWVEQASDQGIIPLPIGSVGSDWKRTYTVDIAGFHEEARSLVIGACHWQRPFSIEKSVANLIKRTPALIPDYKEWSVYYLVFSSNGLTKEDREQAKAVVAASKTSRAKKKWKPVGVRCLDLAELDADLAGWSTSLN